MLLLQTAKYIVTACVLIQFKLQRLKTKQSYSTHTMQKHCTLGRKVRAPLGMCPLKYTNTLTGMHAEACSCTANSSVGRGVEATPTRNKTNRMNSNATDLLIEIKLSVSVLVILSSKNPHQPPVHQSYWTY